MLPAALHQAVRWGWLRENIAERAKPPRVSNRRVTAPAVEVVQQVIKEAERRDPRLAPLLMLAALTGMRRGEVCALRWSDVTLDLGVLDLRSGRSIRRSSQLQNIHHALDAGSRCQPCISSQQRRGGQHFGQSDVCCVVGRKVVA